jgi:hypothetical protein
MAFPGIKEVQGFPGTRQHAPVDATSGESERRREIWGEKGWWMVMGEDVGVWSVVLWVY